MNTYKLRHSLLLLLTATIWGVAFVAQSVSMDYVEPFTFNAVRCVIGGIVLLPVIGMMNRRNKAGSKSKTESTAKSAEIEQMQNKPAKVTNKTLWIGGLICGTILFTASNLQQFGMKWTTVGKAGFITAMYIVIVPLLGLFVKKKVGIRIWCGVAIAVAGLYLLCMNGGFSFQTGDLLVLACALLFSFHILVVDHYAPLVDGVKMSCIQFFTSGVLSAIAMIFTEKPEISQILAAWVPLLYAGALSCGVAYTLQIVGQKGLNPTAASLIMSLESVISVLAGWLLLGQTLSSREIIGCVLMFAAIILVQLPAKRKIGYEKQTLE